MALTPIEIEVLATLQDNDSSRGLTEGEVRIKADLIDAENLLEALISIGLVEKRDQTSEFWPSGRPAEAIPLAGGQIRSRTRYCATPAGLSFDTEPPST